MNAPVGPPAPKVAPGERAPKRALTSYMVFVKETRPAMVKNNPNMTVREIVSNLAKQWREMADEDKKPYESVAVQDKARADKERADWVASGKEIPKRRKKQKRKHKKNKNNEKKVKRVSSAYIFFSVAQRPNIALANPSWQMGDVSKELGRRWREMSDGEKAPYIAKHEADKERHRVETEREQEAQRIEAEKMQAQQARELEQQAQAQAQAASQQQAALQQQFAIQQQQQMMQQQMAMQQLQNQPGGFQNQQLQQQAAIQQQLQMQMQQFQQAQMAQLAALAHQQSDK